MLNVLQKYTNNSVKKLHLLPENLHNYVLFFNTLLKDCR